MDRRKFLETCLVGPSLAAASCCLPAWARPSTQGNFGTPTQQASVFDLTVDRFPIKVNGRSTYAIGVNHTFPAPLLRFLEGKDITLNVHNRLSVDTSIHWHGLLVPFQMDGVPGVTFPGIKPGETFTYKFAVPQNGTYWYHSHSGLQEQEGHYGPIIIDPKGSDPTAYDREYVLVLGDWTFTDPHRLFAKLKKNAESLNYSQRTISDLAADASKRGLKNTLEDRAMWARMRMSPRDIADVSGATYTYVINGHSTADNWNGVFRPGERVRLRIINAAAMTLFNIRMPGLPMTIVQADGLNVQPIDVDEFQIGVAETYDVIIQPPNDNTYAFVAESIDRSGQVVASFATQPGRRSEVPALRSVPTLTMKDMGMDHGGHHAETPVSSHHGHHQMDHASHHTQQKHSQQENLPTEEADTLNRNAGVANIAENPTSRLHEPGIGLENVPHRVLSYADLRSLVENPDQRPPGREIVLHLTSNMKRYMWSFDGVKFSEVTKPIVFHEGERLRLTLINNTMMPHPIHLHGMFFDVVNGGGRHKPRKHTIVVKPAEKLSLDITAEHVGDWAFHCHLLYHMHAGMMQVVSVLPNQKDLGANDKSRDTQHHRHHHGMSH